VIGAIILLLGFGFMWGVEFPGDLVKDDGSLSFSAMHVVFNFAFLFGMFVYFVILLRKTMDQNLEWDFATPDDTESSSTGLVTLAIALLFVIGVSKVYKDSKVIYNQTVVYQNDYKQVAQEKETYYDNMWKSYKFKDNILKDNKATFIEVTKIIMEARSGYKDSKVTWKWVNENQNIPFEEFSKFYSDLSAFVESQRAGYLKLELKSQAIANSNNTLLEILPNNIYNIFLKREKIEYKPGFTSTKTSEVFKTGIEEIE
jgi:hypothetical protein